MNTDFDTTPVLLVVSWAVSELARALGKKAKTTSVCRAFESYFFHLLSTPECLISIAFQRTPSMELYSLGNLVDHTLGPMVKLTHPQKPMT